jgi:CRISPR-associated endonuclease/helicase Cas3
VDYRRFVELAADRSPYPYQQRLAAEGLPDVLRVPTGSGKTLAATLAWLYRRRLHPDLSVRRDTPSRLVFVLPQRSLVEQSVQSVEGWLGRLARADVGEAWAPVGLHQLMGGASSDDRAWKLAPEVDCVLVGTQDMVLSRLLMRGYAEARSSWPMSFGLLHAGTQFVFDEVQLMGPGLGTSIQLEGMRRAFGTAVPSRSMWMSATVDDERLGGFPDLPELPASAQTVVLRPEDRAGELGKVLEARRRIGELVVNRRRYAEDLAREVVKAHRRGTRTIVVLNTVERAVTLHEQLLSSLGAAKGPVPELVLVHSRFRPADRTARLDQVLADPHGPGTIVVSTQVLEAGVDVSSAVMVTELAPWSSIVQRAGRCNRAGKDAAAELLWVRPPGGDGHHPYEAQHLKDAAAQLERLEGRGVTSVQLQGARVPEQAPVHPVLRRRDLIDLFDTGADLSGNDLDVSRWIRDADDRSVYVAWRRLRGQPPGRDEPAARREELCPVPVAQLRAFLKERATPTRAASARAWVRRQPDGAWESPAVAELRVGAVVVLDCEAGGYAPDRGWNPASNSPVEPVPEVRPLVAVADPEGSTGDGDAFGSDPLSRSERAITLTQHLEDVGGEVAQLLTDIEGAPGLGRSHRDAAVRAGLLHDLGKAHPIFQESIRRAGAPESDGPWAKSGTDRRLEHARPFFRHELVSALMIMSDPWLSGPDEPDLVAYLAAAHHGKIRLTIRSAHGEENDSLLGVREDDLSLPVLLPDGREMPEIRLSTAIAGVGATGDGRSSWTARACALRDRPDIGPFRLAYLEAIVRSADWRVSKSYDHPEQPSPKPHHPPHLSHDTEETS